MTLGVTGSTMSFIGGTQRAAKAHCGRAWVDVAKARAEWDAAQDCDVRAEAEPIQSQFVARAIRKALPTNGNWSVDAGNGGKHVRTYFAPTSRAPSCASTMGFGGRRVADRARRKSRPS